MARSDLYKLIISRRSTRLFQQKAVPLKIIKNAINSARVAPSARNLQFIEYLIINKKELRERIFPSLRWAGYVAPARNPSLNMRPAFYIIILINKERTDEPNLRDIGAAAENILLSLLSFCLGGCWLQSIDKQTLHKILKIPSRYEIDSLVAAGYPAEFPKLEADSKNIKYWLDGNNQLHVPKRPLKDIMHYNKIAS
jgi:nitroreductase